MAGRKTMKRTSSKKRGMRGGSALMPSDVSASNDIGNFAASQQNAGALVNAPSNLNLIQSGGKSKRRKGQKGGRLFELQPTEISGSTGPISGEAPVEAQKGGYFPELLKSAIVPFGLMGLNKYAHTYYGKKPYKGKSRLSKRIRSHRKRR